jgi:hypothetical protein
MHLYNSLSDLSAMRAPKISEDMQKLFNILEFDAMHAPSRVSSSKKLNGSEIAEVLQAEAAFTIAHR